MDRPGHETATYFYGREVEHTPALGMETLFVVGLRPTSEITVQVAMAEREIRHIYFGANQSFPNPDFNDFQTWENWENMIWPFLEEGYYCTLDLDLRCAEGLLEGKLTEHDLFIPMISVKLPYAKLWNYNTTIKIDDRDFQATNPGVWCHSLHDLKNRAVFTPWSKYQDDKVAE